MAIVKPSTILEPFAINGDLVVPPATSSATVANQDTGFPLLQSTPIGAGGLPVQRDQMNGVINLYSQFCFWQQCGGVYTFDAAISAQYGGYPAGIVLYCALNNSFQLSKINNNTANFVATPSYINDGIHWQQISGLHGSQTFSTNGTFISPTTDIWITAIAGGGGGAGGYGGVSGESGGGGSSGQYIIKQHFVVTIGASISITIGNGGNGGAVGIGSVGISGGNTIIGSLITLSGGDNGGDGANNFAGGESNPTNSAGQYGTQSPTAGTILPGGPGGSGVFGGVGNQDYDSTLGSGGNGGGATVAGVAHVGRKGGNGFVLIEW